jgi:peptidoglycan/LPS O-acetylase OafA/YrhL
VSATPELRASSHHYRPDIDGLRALAVAAVIIFHYAPSLLPGGYLGVDVFFVISGYLISGIILGDIRAQRFSLVTFYLRRARRILPALLVMFAAVTLLAALVLMPDELERFGSSLTASSLFVPNIALLRETGYFDAEAVTKPLLHLWSLGVEEQFYLIWPLLLLAFSRRLRNSALTLAIAVLALLSLVLQVWMAGRSPSAAFYLPFTRFWELMIGALLAVRAADAPVPGATVSRSSRDAASLLGLVMICVPFALHALPGPPILPVALVPTIGAAIVIAVGPDALLNRLALSRRYVVQLGLISYPLYLWHWPPLSLIRVLAIEDTQLDRTLRVAALIGAVAASILTYRFIELPLRRSKNLPAIGVRLVSALGAAALVGVIIASTHGWPQRTPLATDPFSWPRTLRSEPRCLAKYMGDYQGEEALCVSNDIESPPLVAVLGDSHANALWPGVQAAFGGQPVLQVGASSCPYIRDVDFWVDTNGEHRGVCSRLMAQAYVAAQPARIVILAARGVVYTAGSEEARTSFDLQQAGHFTSTRFPGASPLEIFERSLERDLPWLLTGNRDVVIVQPIPELNFHPRRCLRFRPIQQWMKARLPADCSVLRSTVEARQISFRAMIARVAAKFPTPRLHVVDPMTALCDAERCHAVIGGTTMYRDQHHLSLGGAAYVWSRISPFAPSRITAHTERSAVNGTMQMTRSEAELTNYTATVPAASEPRGPLCARNAGRECSPGSAEIARGPTGRD